MEFTVNEDDNAPFDSPQRRRFEQMLRKLLLLGAAHGGTGIPSHGDWDIEGGTAIVVLHHYAWHATAGDGLAAGLFYNTSEAQLGMFANVSMQFCYLLEVHHATCFMLCSASWLARCFTVLG